MISTRGPRKSLPVAALALCAALGAHAGEAAGAGDASPWLGVYLVDELDGGIRIVAVVPGGPASAAGLRSGDLLVEVAGRPLADQEALERVLMRHPPSQRLPFGILRGDESMTFEVQPSERRPARAPGIPVPDAPAPAYPRGTRLPGLQSVAMTPELRTFYGTAKDRGVLVVRVARGGSADLAGLRVGDVLVGVGTLTVAEPAAVDRAFRRWNRRAALPLRIVRKREQLVIELPAEETRPVAELAPGQTADTVRVRQLERSIALLERQLETLRRQLAELNRPPDAAEPANRDR